MQVLLKLKECINEQSSKIWHFASNLELIEEKNVNALPFDLIHYTVCLPYLIKKISKINLHIFQCEKINNNTCISKTLIYSLYRNPQDEKKKKQCPLN